MPNEKHIYFKNKGVEDFLTNVAIAWKAKYPQLAKLYKEVLEEDKRGLVNASGMSKEGNVMFSGSVPADVFVLITRKYPHFFRNPQNLRKFQEIFCGGYNLRS